MKKTALVTGFEVGIRALEVCKQLQQEGYELIILFENRNEQFEKNSAVIGDAVFEQADFYSAEGMENLISKLKKYQFNAIINCHDALAFNGDFLLHDFLDFNYEEFLKIVQYSVVSIAAICIGLKDNIVPNGCIINITSSAGEEGGFVTIAYNASKAAVKNLSKSLACNLGNYNGIRVNCVAPGWIPKSDYVAGGDTVELANSLTPTPPRGQNKDLAKAVVDVINNSSINGATIVVDGGITSSYLMYMLESLSEKGDKEANDAMKAITNIINNEKAKLAKNR